MFDDQISPSRESAPVLFLSGALGGAGEWTGVAESLGAGFVPARHGDAPSAILDLARYPAGAHVVAHGSAAYDALARAAAEPWRFRSLTLIDPDLAAALPDLAMAPQYRAGRAMRRNVAVYAAEGDAWNAVREAVDFWMGKGAFARSSLALQQRLASRCGPLVSAYARQSARPLDVFDLAKVACPTFVITGSKAAPELRENARLAFFAIPRAKRLLVREAGACAHLTDPHVVGPAVREFLENCESRWQTGSMHTAQAA